MLYSRYGDARGRRWLHILGPKLTDSQSPERKGQRVAPVGREAIKLAKDDE